MELAYKTLLITILIESPIFWLLQRKGRGVVFFLFPVLLNVFTQPVAFLLFQFFSLNFYFVEILVVIAEGCIISLFWKKNIFMGLLFSFIMNFISAFSFLAKPVFFLITNYFQ